MSKIKDLTKDVDVLSVAMINRTARLDTVHADLYASIKEVSELKYRNVELELRLSNLETMVKTLIKGEV